MTESNCLNCIRLKNVIEGDLFQFECNALMFNPVKFVNFKEIDRLQFFIDEIKKIVWNRKCECFVLNTTKQIFEFKYNGL